MTASETKRFCFSVVIWSVAACLHAFATGLTSLSIFGQSWDSRAEIPVRKVSAEWFPQRERALAQGIFNSGVALGSIAAPPRIIWLNLRFGWKATFIVTGLVGFLWLFMWLGLYRSRDEHPWLTEEEKQVSEEGETGGSAEEKSPGYLELLTYKQTWSVIMARFLVDPVWWLYITWLPKYLYDARGFDLKQIGMFAWMPFVAAGLGSLFGGWVASFFIGRGWSVDKARKVILAVSCLLMPAGIVAAYTSDSVTALAMICVVLFGFQVWINNVQTLPSDFFPKSAVGSVAGLGGMGAGIGSIIFTFTTGWVVDHFSYIPILVAAGILGPIGTVVLFALTGRIQKISLKN